MSTNKRFCLLLLYILICISYSFSYSIYASSNFDKHITLPAQLGSVKYIGNTTAYRTVILIQDVHSYYPVQQQIAKIIQYLQENMNIDHVFVEGADTPISAERILSFPDDNVRQKVANYFLKKGKISGVEYLSVLGKPDIFVQGVEDATIYRSNYTAFCESQEIGQLIVNTVHQIVPLINTLKSKVYSSVLIALDRHEALFHSNTETLRNYLLYLTNTAIRRNIDISQFKNISLLTKLIQEEQQLDYQTIGLEKNALISSIQQKLTPEQKITLLDATLAFSLQKTSSLSLFRLLKEFSRTASIPMTEFTQLNRYIDYLETSEKISVPQTHTELNSLVSILRKQMINNIEQTHIYKLDTFLKNLYKVVNLQASRGEIDTYRKNLKWFRQTIQKYVVQYPEYTASFEQLNQLFDQMSSINQFYEYAFDRDSILADNTLNAMKQEQLTNAVLITGGFHTDAITNKLTQQGIQVISIRPKFISPVSKTKQMYESVILGYKNPLENYLLLRWQTLAAALVLVDGSPLAQQWKGSVYRQEMEIMALVAKLASIRTVAEQELGLTSAKKLTDTIASHLADKIQFDTTEFLKRWNTKYEELTQKPHPFIHNIDVSIQFEGTDIFASLTINNQTIYFPIHTMFAVQPGAILNAYLTPDRFTELLAGTPILNEEITSIDELKLMRQRLRNTFISPHTASDQLNAQDQRLIRSIVQSLASTAPDTVQHALEQVALDKDYALIEQTVTDALFEARIDSISAILSEKIAYSQLYDLVKYGATAPLRVLRTTLQDEQPDIAYFADFLIKHFSAFSISSDMEDVMIVLNDLHNQYVISDSIEKGTPLNTRILRRLSKIIYTSLNYGDGIRPHRVVAILAYGFSPFDRIQFIEFWQMHNLLEQLSLYDKDEIIRLIFLTRWLNPTMIRPLISLNLPYPQLRRILKLDEIALLRRNPTSHSFSKFKQTTDSILTPQAQLGVFAGSIEQYEPLRAVFIKLTKSGFTSKGEINKRFVPIALRIKQRANLAPADTVLFDSILMNILGRIPDELIQPQKSHSYTGVLDFEQLDRHSTQFQEQTFTHFSKAVGTGRTQQISLIASIAGFPLKPESVTTSAGIDVSRTAYRTTLSRFLEEQDKPVILIANYSDLDATRAWLNSLSLNSIVVLVGLDYTTGDLAIDSKKSLPWLGYWMNLNEMLTRNFRSLQMNIIGFDKRTFRRFDSIHRTEISLENFIARYAKLTDKEKQILAGKGNAVTLSNLIRSGNLSEQVVTQLIQNEYFNKDHLIAILHNGTISLPDSFYSSVTSITKQHNGGSMSKFGRFEYKDIFSGIQNNRTGHLFAQTATNDSLASMILGDIDNGELLANLVAHAYRHGFRFKPSLLPSGANLNHLKWKRFITRLMIVSAGAASDFLASVVNYDPAVGQRFIEQLGSRTEYPDETTDLFALLLVTLSEQDTQLQELIPFVLSDTTPLWHKAYIINQSIQQGIYADTKHQYIYTILNVFGEQSDFVEWIQINYSKYPDRVTEWMKVVSLFPQIDELRSPFMLKSAIMTDMHILIQYREFLTQVAMVNGQYTRLPKNPEELRLIFQALNSDFALPIESKMFVFNILPYIIDFIPNGMTIIDIFDTYVEKTNPAGKVLKEGIPVYAILPALVFSETDKAVLNDFKSFFSDPKISSQRAVKVNFTSYFLRVFSEINQARLHTLLGASKISNDLFLETIKLTTAQDQRRQIMKNSGVRSNVIDSYATRFDTARRHRAIIVKTMQYANKDHFNKRNQRALMDAVHFMAILNDNFNILSTGEGILGKQFTELLNTLEQFPSALRLKDAVMNIFISFIQLDFPDVFESQSDIIKKLPRIEQVTNYWLYKTDWETENQHGLSLLRDAVKSYLKDGTSLKWIKYGGTPQSVRQLELYKAILTKRWTDYYINNEGLQLLEAQKNAVNRARQFVDAWQRDLTEPINLSDFPQLDKSGTFVAWTSDDVPQWLNFGLSGGCTCLAPGNIVSYTKNLPGYMFSALVTGGVYIGRYKGDIRDRVNQAVLPIVDGGKPHMYLVNQYYYSSGGDIGDMIGTASIITSIRNSARYGTDGVVIPKGSPQFGYFEDNKDFFLNDFSTIVEQRDLTGKVIARERITIDSAESRNSLTLHVPRETNQWRYFDAAQAYKGTYYDKLNENFSFVDFTDSVPQELDGISFDGLDVEVNSVILHIHRQPLPLLSQTPAETTQALSKQLSAMEDNNHLDIISSHTPQIKELITRLARSDTTTGENLNIVLKASQLMAENIGNTLLDIRSSMNTHYLLLTFTRTGVPIARKIGEMLEEKLINYNLAYISSDKQLREFPDSTDTSVAKPLFIIDEAIVTGTTSARNIDIVLNKQVKPEDIVIVALTADPRALERLARKYPGIKFIIGTLEERTEQQGSYISIALNDLKHKTQPLTLTKQERVKVGGIEYRILDRIQRGKSFVVFHAEMADGKKVILKTTVSANEGARLKNISDLVAKSPKHLGVPRFYQYDEPTGILVTALIDGPSLGDYLKQNYTDLANAVIRLLYALNDMTNVAGFLEQHNSLFVNMNLNNIRFDTETNTWYLTNYSPFPYRLQPLDEHGVLEQLGYILEESIRIILTHEQLTEKHGLQAIQTLQTLLDNIRKGTISSIAQLQTKILAIRVELFTPQMVSQIVQLPPTQLNRLNRILSDKDIGNLVAERLFSIIQSGKYPVSDIQGLLSLGLQNSSMNDRVLSAYFLRKLEPDLEILQSLVTTQKKNSFIYIDDTHHIIQRLAEDSTFAKPIINRLRKDSDILQTQITPALLQQIKHIRAGQSVVIAGNYELVRWMANELYARAGQRYEQRIIIVPALSDYSYRPDISDKYITQPLRPVHRIAFVDTIRHGFVNIVGTEATLMDWSTIVRDRNLEPTQADIIRRRIIRNPDLNFVIRNLRAKRIGFISLTLRKQIDAKFLRDIPLTQPDGRNLILYSSYLDVSRRKERYRTTVAELISAIATHKQYPRLYRIIQLNDIFSYFISKHYLPFMSNQIDIPSVLTNAHSNHPAGLIELFPNHSTSIDQTLRSAIMQVWQTNGTKLHGLVQSKPAQFFIYEFMHLTVQKVIEKQLNKKKLILPTDIIRSLFGETISPYEIAVYSEKINITDKSEFERIYNEYVAFEEQVDSHIKPISKSTFFSITFADGGIEAFQKWLKIHNLALADYFSQLLNGTISDLPVSMIKQFTDQLHDFSTITTRQLRNKAVQQHLVRNHGELKQYLSDVITDPFNQAQTVDNLNTAFIITMKYKTQEEQLFWLKWMDEDVFEKLHTFLKHIPNDTRTEIEKTLAQLDYLTFFPQIELALKTILVSPLSQKSRIALLTSKLDTLGSALSTFNPKQLPVLLDASNINTLPEISGDTRFVLIGDYYDVRRLYIALITHLPPTSNKLRDDFVQGIVGFAPLISRLPAHIPDELRTPFVQFSVMDNIRISSAYNAMFNPPERNVFSFFDGHLNAQIVSTHLINALGNGGVIVQIAHAINKRVENLTKFIIRYDYTDSAGRVFVRIRAVFDDTPYNVVTKLEIIDRQGQNRYTSALQQTDRTPAGFTQIIQPIARRVQPISDLFALKLTFYEPNSSDMTILDLSHLPDDPVRQMRDSAQITLLRKRAQILSRLWNTTNFLPTQLDGSFLVDHTQHGDELKILFDSTEFKRIIDTDEFWFTLFAQGIVPFYITPSDYNAWQNSIQVPIQINESVIDGILDGLDGNITLFKKLGEQIISENNFGDLTSTIIRYSDSILTNYISSSEIDEVHRQLYKMFVATPVDVRNYDFGSFRRLPIMAKYSKQVTLIKQFANRLRRQFIDSATAINSYIQSDITQYQVGHISEITGKFYAYLYDHPASGTVERFKKSQEFMTQLQLDPTLMPSQLIEARIFLSLRIVQSQLNRITTTRINETKNDTMYSILKQIGSALRSNPADFLNQFHILLKKSGYDEEILWLSVLPGYDASSKTFAIHGNRFRVSALSALLRAEQIVSTKPILIIGDSSALNFEVFEHIKKLFHLPVMDFDNLTVSEREQKRMGLTNKPQTKQGKIQARTYRQYLIRQWNSRQQSSYFIDLAVPDRDEFITNRPDNTVFDLRKIQDVYTFLEQFVLQYDSNIIDRLNFDLDIPRLEKVFGKFSQQDQDELNRFLQDVIRIRYALHNAINGNKDQEDIFTSLASSYGFADRADEILTQAYLMNSTSQVTALIVESMRKTYRYPSLEDLFTRIHNANAGTITEIKFNMMLDIYTQLAIEYFARYIEQTAKQGDVNIDIHLATIKQAHTKIASLDTDFSFIFQLLKSAKISYKVFQQGTTASAVIKFSQQLTGKYKTAIDSISEGLKTKPYLIPELDQNAQRLKYKLRHQQRLILDQSL